MNFRLLGAAAAAILAMSALESAARGSETDAPGELDLQFTIHDARQQPLPGLGVRLVLGDAAGWQSAASGHRFTTDARGEHRATLSAPIVHRMLKRPTNFVSSLFSRAEPTDFLQVAVELDYAGARRLYVIALHRFRDGAVLRDGFAIFTEDDAGGFTRRAEFDGRDWKMPDLGGLLLTTPGLEVTETTFQPETENTPRRRWSLKLGLRRSDEPVRVKAALPEAARGPALSPRASCAPCAPSTPRG